MAAPPLVTVNPVPAVIVVPALILVPALTNPDAVTLPDDAAMLPVVAVIPVPAVTVVPALSDPDTEGLLTKLIVKVLPAPVVLIFDPLGTFSTPATGVAVPEPVTNEFAVAPLVSKFKLFAPVVKVIVPPVEVSVANAGSAPVAPNNTWPLVPTDKAVRALAVPSATKTPCAVCVPSFAFKSSGVIALVVTTPAIVSAFVAN